MIALVSCGTRPAAPASPGPRVRPARESVELGMPVVRALRRAGLEPLVVPPGAGPLDGLLAGADAVVLTGGAFDIHPARYGQRPRARLDRTDPARTDTELALAAAAMAQDLPVLGICGGLQALVVAAGGTLVQDIASEVPGALEHEQPTDPAMPWHEVQMEGMLARELGVRFPVNSTHHQACADPGRLAVAGRAPDGVVEAVHLPGHRFCVGVQWHPELLDHPVFDLLAAAARRGR